MNGKQKSENLLCIFSRFPEEGRCKTRLIPELGAQGASDLQRQMSEHIITVGNQAHCDLLLFVDGGSDANIESWLGGNIDFVYQSGADLGERMLNAFDLCFARGYQHVVLVGSDCPSIDGQIIAESFTTLASCDLVFGPTFDGGYYMVGMAQRHPEIFVQIHWGTGQVLQQSLALATGLEVKLLPTLHDVDSPEDLLNLPEFMQVKG